MNEPSRFSQLLKGSRGIWTTERPNQLAAGLAYFGIFSFAPIIYIAFAVAGLFLDSGSLMDNALIRLEGS